MFPQDAYYTAFAGIPPVREVADRVYRQVFRRDFTAPGVALLSFGHEADSTSLRAFMVSLKDTLDGLYRRAAGRRLIYLSMARFNQQATTKFHLDGAPDDAWLMLGYEPSAVPSAVSIADYTRAAHDWGIEPRTLLNDYNPMYADHETRLLPYVTRLQGFDAGSWQVLLLNNSSLPWREDNQHTLGVMHQATILTPMPGRNRVVNSTMIGAADLSADEPIEPSLQRAFIETQTVAALETGIIDG